jgi:hypothetical protein
MVTEYDLNNNKFKEDLSVASEYQNNNLRADTEIKYSLNKNRINNLENTLEYELSGEWGWYVENNISYDFEEPVDERLEEANLTIKKKLHCRQLKLSYDYLDEEWLLTYDINIFPGEDVTIGQQQGERLFRFGLEDDLKSE